MIFGVFSYLLLCSRLLWAFHEKFDGLGPARQQRLRLLMIALLIALPIREPADAASGPARSANPASSTGPVVEDVPDLVEIDRRVSAAFDAKDAGAARPRPKLAATRRRLAHTCRTAARVTRGRRVFVIPGG